MVDVGQDAPRAEDAAPKSHRARFPGFIRRHKALTVLTLIALVLIVSIGTWLVIINNQLKDIPRFEADFDRPDAPWLVVVFTSATCDTCAGVWERAQHLASDAVAVQEAEVTARKDLHDRYAIEAVPATLVADADGVVVRSFLGPVTATDLWAAVAEAREPGSTPDSCH